MSEDQWTEQLRAFMISGEKFIGKSRELQTENRELLKDSEQESGVQYVRK